MAEHTALVWLRNDLRLGDNPALSAAVHAGGNVVALYVHESGEGLRPPGGAASWWLHHSLEDLSAALAKHGVPLLVRAGPAEAAVKAVAQETGAASAYSNRRYGPAEIAIDNAVAAMLKADGIETQSFAANVLAEPWTVQTKTGNSYSVFTPFWHTLKAMDIATPLRLPKAGKAIRHTPVDTEYQEPNWAEKLGDHWQIGEAGAHAALTGFLDDRLDNYPEERDFPARAATSKLSPHLRFGEISPRQVWHAAQSLAQREPRLADAADKFLRQLAWRDFNYHQLYHRADIATVPMKANYPDIAWRQAPADLAAWQQGRTGFPIVDAGMRELWATGYMQNRIRLLVGSLLAKNLLIDWRLGEQWFWDCLVDADIANNPGNWQWVAGSGLDASPYFRIFNPVTQGERFDGAGDYVRQWVPELAKLPDAWIQQPFVAPADVLRQAGVALGETYPRPIVELKPSRERALAAVKRS